MRSEVVDLDRILEGSAQLVVEGGSEVCVDGEVSSGLVVEDEEVVPKRTWGERDASKKSVEVDDEED